LDRLDRMQQFLSTRLEALQAAKPAVQALYAALTPEERGILDPPFRRSRPPRPPVGGSVPPQRGPCHAAHNRPRCAAQPHLTRAGMTVSAYHQQIGAEIGEA